MRLQGELDGAVDCCGGIAIFRALTTPKDGYDALLNRSGLPHAWAACRNARQYAEQGLARAWIPADGAGCAGCDVALRRSCR